MLVLVLVNMVRMKVALRTTNESILRAMYEWFTPRGEISKIDRTMRFWHTQLNFTVYIVVTNMEKLPVLIVGQKP
jgi:hypothetical protein